MRLLSMWKDTWACSLTRRMLIAEPHCIYDRYQILECRIPVRMDGCRTQAGCHKARSGQPNTESSCKSPTAPPCHAGNGSQWPRMAAELLEASPVFRASIAACAAALQRYSIDLLAEFGRADGWSTPALAMAGLSAVQAGATL